jgi:hypothetical protein
VKLNEAVDETNMKERGAKIKKINWAGYHDCCCWI